MGRRLAGDHPSPAVATALSTPSLPSHEQPGIGSLPLSAIASRRAKLAASAQKLKERASLEGAAIVGVDRVKRVFQVHGAAAGGSIVFRKNPSRRQFIRFAACRD